MYFAVCIFQCLAQFVWKQNVCIQMFGWENAWLREAHKICFNISDKIDLTLFFISSDSAKAPTRYDSLRSILIRVCVGSVFSIWMTWSTAQEGGMWFSSAKKTVLGPRFNKPSGRKEGNLESILCKCWENEIQKSVLYIWGTQTD